MSILHTQRVVIVGAGLGALYAALKLAPLPILMISPETLGEGASSAWAQGGVAAAMDPADSAQSHATDTVRAGAGTVDSDVAINVADAARAHILDLTDMGTPFDRTADGGYVMSREAAHSFARVVRVKGDQAGAEIMKALITQVRATPSIQVLEGVTAIGLEVVNHGVTGVHIQKAHGMGSAPVLLRGSACLLAGGGSGGLYALTTNPKRIRGQVIGLAARAGAMIADPEFVQFHPTAIDVGEDPAPLATEALRGEGATLINNAGYRFMVPLHADAELAPRDIVARAVYAETQSGNRPVLDTRQVLGARVLLQYPSVAEACLRNEINPANDTIPIAAAAHYHMGGIDTDENGRASLGGLWVCGEASSTGLHGANRLASNGLLEALVYARECALDISTMLGPEPEDVPELSLTWQNGGTVSDEDQVSKLRQVMTDHVGVIRNAAGLRTALVEIACLEHAQETCVGFLNMTATATLITAAALVREESRGAHYREDFPESDGDIGERTKITLDQAMNIRSRVLRETAK